MKSRVELKLRYENGNEIHIVAEQGIIKGKPAVWKYWEVKSNLATNLRKQRKELFSVELSDTLRREIAQYFGVKYG